MCEILILYHIGSFSLGMVLFTIIGIDYIMKSYKNKRII